ncbi:NAD(P)H-dependent amine dehydrogenase family protein [Halioxenophilus aromaticivorans]|uniref:Dihydrodipicolinate reductase n=1 Tax=Halioxenophilus aromaticivorans TaxID=1306992 RepID=A0AAV3U7K8_9ALTE
MRAPYKVIVWGPGIVGKACMKEVLKKPELELVGVLAYSADKNELDVGTFLGMNPVGLAMTTDQEAMIALEADVVIFSVNMSAELELNSDATNIACRLLESGKSLVTSAGWWYPAYHDQALHDKLEAACKKGGSCLHGTGVNPGWLYERIIGTLTGASTVIKHIHVQELSDNSHIESADMMRGLGYNSEMSTTPWIENVGDRGYCETLALTCKVMGVKLDRIDSEKKYFVAREDLKLIPFTVQKGRRNGVNFLYHAIVEGKKFITLEEIWYVDERDLPAGLHRGDYYNIKIEGEPVSLRGQFQLMASVEENLERRPGDHTLPAYYATAIPLIQAIPIVCGAEPGIVLPFNFANYVPDLRKFNSPLMVR